MPFFRGNLKKLKNQWVTLQVRILKIKKAVTVGKKVSLSASASLTVEAALVLCPEHLSCYGLTVEEGTPLAQRVARGERLPDDDEQAVRYLWTV